MKSEEEAPPRPKYAPLIVMPIIFVGSILSTLVLPEFIGDFYLDVGLPFLVSFWVGMGFTYAWDSVRYSMHVEKMPPLVVALTGLLSAFFLLSMIGLDTLWSDPWLFGVAIWPGLAMARPWLEQRFFGSPVPGHAGASDPVQES